MLRDAIRYTIFLSALFYAFSGFCGEGEPDLKEVELLAASGSVARQIEIVRDRMAKQGELLKRVAEDNKLFLARITHFTSSRTLYGAREFALLRRWDRGAAFISVKTFMMQNNINRASHFLQVDRNRQDMNTVSLQSMLAELNFNQSTCENLLETLSKLIYEFALFESEVSAAPQVIQPDPLRISPRASPVRSLRAGMQPIPVAWWKQNWFAISSITTAAFVAGWCAKAYWTKR